MFSWLAFVATLIGGTVVPNTDYPEIVYLTVNHGYARCSGTAIDEHVVLTAGHCVIGDGSATFKVGAKSYTAQCEASPEYQRTSSDNDMGLCLVDGDLADFATAVVQDPLKVGDEVLLTGYGCIKQGGGGGNDGTLRVGKAKITEFMSSWFLTYGAVAICSGDSGSAALLPGHIVAGVNSRGDLKKLSLMTALWLPKAKAFIQDWTSRNGQ